MRFVIALVLLLVAAPLARAESSLPEKEVRPELARTEVEVKAPTQPELKVAKVKAEAPAAATATQEMPRRGSFLWLVGVIVVAIVIAAVIL
jgi:hypothetical protein